jgi:hypothetical protein
MEGAMKTGAWIVTGGTDNGAYGVMRLVGDAAEEYSHFEVPVLGVATWGCVAGREQLLGERTRDDVATNRSQRDMRLAECARYQTTEELDGQSANLNLHHRYFILEYIMHCTHTLYSYTRYFILVDSGRDGQWGDEVELRSKVEHAICNPQDAWERRATAAAAAATAAGGGAVSGDADAVDARSNSWVPVKPGLARSYSTYQFKNTNAPPIHQVMISVGGGPGTLKTLLDAVKKESISVLVVSHSGRVSSLVAVTKDIIDRYMRRQVFSQAAKRRGQSPVARRAKERKMGRLTSFGKRERSNAAAADTGQSDDMDVDDICAEVLHIGQRRPSFADTVEGIEGGVADTGDGIPSEGHSGGMSSLAEFWQLLNQEFPNLDEQHARCREVVEIAMHRNVRVYRPSSPDQGDLAECIISSVKDAQTLEESIKLAVYWNLDGMFKKGSNNLLSELSTLSEEGVSDALQTGLRCALEMNRQQFVHLFLTNGASVEAVNLGALYELGDIEEAAITRSTKADGRAVVLRIFKKEFKQYLRRTYNDVHEEEEEVVAANSWQLLGSMRGKFSRHPTRMPAAHVKAAHSSRGTRSNATPSGSLHELLAWAILTHRTDTVAVLLGYAEDKLSAVLLGFDIFKRLLPRARVVDNWRTMFACSKARGGLKPTHGLKREEIQREFQCYQELVFDALVEAPAVPGFLAPNGIFDELVRVARNEWSQRGPEADLRTVRGVISTPVMKAGIEQKWAAFGSRYYKMSVVGWYAFLVCYICFVTIATERSQQHLAQSHGGNDMWDRAERPLATATMICAILHALLTLMQFSSACVAHSRPSSCVLTISGVSTAVWEHALKLPDLAFYVCALVVASQHTDEDTEDLGEHQLPQWEREVMAVSMLLACFKSLLCLRGFERVGVFVQVLMTAIMHHLVTFVCTISIVIGCHIVAIFCLFDGVHAQAEGTIGVLAMFRMLIGYFEQDDISSTLTPVAIVVLTVYTFTVVIIFLNLLIAVFNASFRRWDARRAEHQLLEKASIILDIQLCLTPWQTKDQRLFPPHLLAVSAHSKAAVSTHVTSQSHPPTPRSSHLGEHAAAGQPSSSDPEALNGIYQRLDGLEELTHKVVNRLKAISTRQLTSLQILRLGANAGVHFKDI